MLPANASLRNVAPTGRFRIISVVIPTNRLDRWLDQAAESVLAETIPGLQLVVVLDGVDFDDADERAWTSDPRVSFIRNPSSLGPAAAMNAAIDATDTPYLARLDSDDLNLPSRLADQLAHLEANPEVVAASSRTYRIDEEGARQGMVRLPAGDDIRRHLLLSNIVPHSTLTFRRDAAERAGRYEHAFRQMEDYDFILRLAAIGPISQFEEPLVEYRVHSAQSSRGAEPRGAHITAIRRDRLALARILGVSGLRARVEHAVWAFAQHLRWWGVIRPGHER